MSKAHVVLEKLTKILEIELATLKDVAQQSKKGATDSEMKQEGKYDTRKIEASYLASAQERRVHEVESELNLLNSIKLHENTNTIEIGTLFKLEHDRKIQTYTIYPCAGGHHIQVENDEIIILSNSSPLGEEALGLDFGDSFEVELGGQDVEYKILPC